MATEKSVFISYRRADIYLAQLVYTTLVSEGYDCFLDIRDMPAGPFDETLHNQIRMRAHFVLILTPNIVVPRTDDVVRQEIEWAIAYKRHIMPLKTNTFKYEDSDTKSYFSDNLLILRRLHGIPLSESVKNSIEEIKKVLDEPIEVILYPHTSVGTLAQVEYLLRKGREVHKLGDLELSFRYFSEAINTNPSHALSYYHRAISRYDMGDKEGAKNDYMSAIGCDKLLVEAYFNLGSIYLEESNLDMAISQFTKIVNLDVPSANKRNAHYSLGNVYQRKEQHLLAVQHFTRAIEIDPSFAAAYCNRANVYRETQQFDKAEVDYESAIQFDNTLSAAYYSRANLYSINKQWDKAIRNYETLVFIDPHFNLNAYLNWAEAYENIGNYTEANDIYRKLIELQPDDAAFITTKISMNELKIRSG